MTVSQHCNLCVEVTIIIDDDDGCFVVPSNHTGIKCHQHDGESLISLPHTVIQNDDVYTLRGTSAGASREDQIRGSADKIGTIQCCMEAGHYFVFDKDFVLPSPVAPLCPKSPEPSDNPMYN